MFNLIVNQNKKKQISLTKSASQLDLCIPVQFCFCGSFKNEIILQHKSTCIASLSNIVLLCANLGQVIWWY